MKISFDGLNQLVVYCLVSPNRFMIYIIQFQIVKWRCSVPNDTESTAETKFYDFPI